MKRKLFVMAACCAVILSVKAQTPELFTPYKATNLRVPSVPLVVNDPYFSIWSPYDELNAGTTRHWTNDQMPLTGMLRVDGVPYRFMGGEKEYILETIVPMADVGPWRAQMTRQTPAAGWEKPDFDAAGWRRAEGAFGNEEYPSVRTRWADTNSDIYVRRSVEISEEDAAADLYLVYSHDDVFELYINGEKVVDTGHSWKTGVVKHLDGKLKSLLKPGKNLIAAHCHNTAGGAYLDFGIFKNVKKPSIEVKLAKQKSVNVLATNTYYTFECGPVELDVVFTAPMLIDNLDLLSTPINYISYQVRATDKKAHDVQFYLGASPEIAVNKATQPTVTTITAKEGVTYAKSGTIEQPILAKKGDGICIDWGYLYLPAINGSVSISDEETMVNTFASTGKLAESKEKIVCRKAAEQPALAYVHDFGTTQQAASYALIGYDEVLDIEYFFHRYKGYWARNGKTIFQAFNELNRDYASIMQRCRQLDQRIYDDGVKSGNQKYAEILSASYRHVIAAHKLFEDKDGNRLRQHRRPHLSRGSALPRLQPRTAEGHDDLYLRIQLHRPVDQALCSPRPRHLSHRQLSGLRRRHAPRGGWQHDYPGCHNLQTRKQHEVCRQILGHHEDLDRLSRREWSGPVEPALHRRLRRTLGPQLQPLCQGHHGCGRIC